MFMLSRAHLQLPEDFAVVYSQVQGEIVVGGVFLRLFIAQPTWVSTFSVSVCPELVILL